MPADDSNSIARCQSPLHLNLHPGLQRAEELRKKLADSISGASRSELFGGMSGGAAQPQSHQEVSGKVSLGR